MTAAIDLKDKIFTRLRVLHRLENSHTGLTRWECLCDPKFGCCGQVVPANGRDLRRGNTRSCGCLNKESVIAAKTIHGFSHLPEYKIWWHIKDRCYNEKASSYDRYGARGITVCDEWKESFDAFHRDMGDRPSPTHSIERKDNSLGYSKSNCKWATLEEQGNNKRNNVLCEYRGQTKTLAQWCRDFRLNYKTIYQRLQRGWSFEEAILPIGSKSITFEDTTHPLNVWCDMLGLDLEDTCFRILKGEKFEDIVTE